MPLAMNREVFITCAVTGSGGTQDRSPHVPRSPEKIAAAAIDAAKAGAAIVHCHVRDPETGKPRRDVHLYREVTERIREANVDVVLNLTAGMGGDMVFGPPENPLPLKTPGTDMGSATERMEHVRQCLPEICTLDCGTMNFAEADYVMTNTPGMLRAMGGMMTALGVRPEIEAFDTGHLWFAKQLVSEGVLAPQALVQLCMGVPWGAPDDLNTFMAMVNNVPPDWTWSAFSLGRSQMAYVAAAVLAGGNVRVGLEDNLWLDKGVLATNAQLVERAATIIENMGARVLGPEEVRAKLNLSKRAPLALGRLTMALGSVKAIEEFTRTKLSRTFFVRDFLYSTIAAHHRLSNLPTDPETFIAAGKQFCERILEPLQDRFGRLAIRSAYRSGEVNRLGQERYGTCGSNESNFGAHIWDRRTLERGLLGAMATVVVPAYLDHYERTGEWEPLAWWLHDHVDYHEMCFFNKLCAFNIGWREEPVRRITNWIERARLLTKPGMANHAGDHSEAYAHVPLLAREG